MRRALGISLAASLALVAPAVGQAQQPAQAATPQPSGDDISPTEIANFAQATLKLHALSKPTPEEMVSTISATDLTVERYNQITQKMAQDVAFKQRVDAELIKLQAQAHAGPAVPPPPLPTAGVGVAVLNLLDKVCIPMVRENVSVADAAPRLGFKRDRRDGSFKGDLGEKLSAATVFPRGANQTVCNIELRFPLGQGDEVSRALNLWTQHQTPELPIVRNDVAVGADGLKRTTLSWERTTQGATSALVFVRVQNADGSPIESGVGSATLLYSERPA